MPEGEFRLNTTLVQRIVADTVTPVGVYLSVRDAFPESILFETRPYNDADAFVSYIACRPIVSFRVSEREVFKQIGERRTTQTLEQTNLRKDSRLILNDFFSCFHLKQNEIPGALLNGFFGYLSYDATPLFEDVTLGESLSNDPLQIPNCYYRLYRYLFVLNHRTNELSLFINSFVGEEINHEELQRVEKLAAKQFRPPAPVQFRGDRTASVSDEQFSHIVEQALKHIARGDVFQIVLSRSYAQPFLGDEFSIFRALRLLNPSPYQFYFDYGDFKLFGASPEAQIIVTNRRASLFPIAGTAPRTGNDEHDQKIREVLRNDPKESAEHVMLVDLARNDLSRNCSRVEVKEFKRVTPLPYVFHLESKVSGELNGTRTTVDALLDSFPAGTLTGAPKIRAMELIDQYEQRSRGYYGGCLGVFTLTGDCNHAILIRSFLSQANTLRYQAGAGIVADSQPERELAEIQAKLSPLTDALRKAEGLPI